MYPLSNILDQILVLHLQNSEVASVIARLGSSRGGNETKVRSCSGESRGISYTTIVVVTEASQLLLKQQDHFFFTVIIISGTVWSTNCLELQHHQGTHAMETLCWLQHMLTIHNTFLHFLLFLAIWCQVWLQYLHYS